MIKPIKGMLSVTVGSVIAGAAIGTVGAVNGLSSGIKSITQTGISLGLLGHSAGVFFGKKR